MTRYDLLADSIIRMEGSMLEKSVNMRMVREHGLWNVGHLVWAGQRGAVPVNIGGRLWAGWPTYDEARAGLIRQIRLDASRGLTLQQFVTKYAPPTENDTAAYISHLSSATGIPPDGTLQDYLDSEVQYASIPRSPDLSPLGLGVEEAPSINAEQAGFGGVAGVLILLAAAGAVAVTIRN